MSLTIEEHRHYLADEARLAAFRRALAAVVRPGDVVLDMGSGSGILGFLACQAGAGRVHAIDAGEIVGLARDLARANGLADRVRTIRAVSTWTTLPEPVDVIVCDQVGQFGFDAGIVQCMSDARRRLLKPGGRLVPGALQIHVAPCTHAVTRDAVEFWADPVSGLDVSCVRPLAANTSYPQRVTPEELLAAPQPVVRIDLAVADGDLLEGAVTFEVTEAGPFDGFAGWFVAELAPGVTMTNGPGAPGRIRRRQVVLPVDRRTPVQPGDRIALSVRIRPVEAVIEWQATVSDAGGVERARFRHSTFAGMLVSSEDLSRTRPDTVPVLSPIGRAHAAVLALCDGRHTIREIERDVRARYSDLLPDDAAAATFVSDVLTRHAE